MLVSVRWKDRGSQNLLKAIIAGLAGTLLFDIVGFIVTGQWWDIPSLLGG